MRVMEVYEAGSANQDEEGAKRCLWPSQFKQHPYGTATQQTCSSDRVARSRRMPCVAGDLSNKTGCEIQKKPCPATEGALHNRADHPNRWKVKAALTPAPIMYQQRREPTPPFIANERAGLSLKRGQQPGVEELQRGQERGHG